jgi:spermidine/putrescine transport system substrate-binding protein
MQSRGLLSPIEGSNIENLKYINPKFRNLSFDPQGKYSIPYAYGFTAMVYNSKLIKDTINSWKALWNPKYKDNILMTDNMLEVFWVANRILEQPFDTNPSNLKKALDLLIIQKPLLKKYESNTTRELMLNGDASIAMTWNGLIARLNTADQKFKLAMPKEGTPFFVDNLCIPASAPHKKNAEKFINFLLDPANSARNIEMIQYAMPNEQARLLLEPSLRDNLIMFPNLADISFLDLIEDKGDFNKQVDKAWTDLMAR